MAELDRFGAALAALLGEGAVAAAEIEDLGGGDVAFGRIGDLGGGVGLPEGMESVRAAVQVIGAIRISY